LHFPILLHSWQIDFHTFSKFITMSCGGIEPWENVPAHVAHGLPTWFNEVSGFKKTHELAYECQFAKTSVPNKRDYGNKRQHKIFMLIQPLVITNSNKCWKWKTRKTLKNNYNRRILLELVKTWKNQIYNSYASSPYYTCISFPFWMATSYGKFSRV
jgi:hypothetical protein